MSFHIQPRLARPHAFAAALLLLASAAAQASGLLVTVTGADGQPAANVVVQVLPSAATPARAPGPVVTITQKDTRFVPLVTAVPVGTTVRFTNLDTYDHHIRSQPGGPLGTLPPARNIELRLAGAVGDKTSSAEVKLDTPGSILLGCHIHGSMRGHLFIASTPYVAVTDANGRANLAELPEGAAEVRLWHPEQLGDQAPLHTSLAANGALLNGVLNFTPRKPRPARSY